MVTDIYIFAGFLQTITRGEGDVTCIPPEGSLIVSAPDWTTMCAEAGGEATLIEAMGLTDIREVA